MLTDSIMVPKKQADQDVAILVVSCDAYQDLWQPFFKCFFKYWPDCPYSVYLGSNNIKYQDPRVESILVGPDVDYSSNLITMLQSVRQSWVILWIEDRFLSSPVDTKRVDTIIKEAQENDVGYSKLIASYPFSMNNDHQDTGVISKGSRYRVCATVALWNKNVLQKLLEPGETVWEFEKKGSVRSDSLTEKFWALSFSVRNSPPIRDMHILIKGKLIRQAKGFLMQESLISLLESRSFQSVRSHLYMKMYLKFNYLIHLLKWNFRL